jgi:hypothetical protein
MTSILVRVIHCCVLLAATTAAAQVAGSRMQTPETAVPFEFPSPADALRTLKSRPGVEVRHQPGWTILDDRANYTIWSFTEEGQAAYPAGIKRVLVQDASGNISVVMSAKCGGPKPECDKLIEEFTQLNDRMRQGVKRQLGETK